MSENETKLKARLIKEKASRFNELAESLKLTEEELADYDTKTEEGLDAGIQSLRILKGRKNAWEEAIPSKEKGFFHPAERTNTKATPKPEKGDETPKQAPQRFNMAQLGDARLAPDDAGELEGSDNTIMRVYSYTDLHGNPRFNMEGYKI